MANLGNQPDVAGPAGPPAPAPAAQPAPGPAPAPPHAAVEIRVTIPNLRNGRAEDITQAAPRASISKEYKWPHIGDMSAPEYVTLVADVIAANYARLVSARGAGITDAERTACRNRAIVLGSIRAGASAAMSLQRTDFNASEVAGTGSEVHTGVVRGAAGNATAAGNHTIAGQMAELTPPEVDVVNALIYLGMAVPVMQGVSLTLSGHHYLPTTKNVFEGMKRQTLQAGGQAVSAWIDAMGDDFADMAFHKACHPILPALKRTWAKSPDMAARLTASGHGAAAIRLPAMPSDAQAGKASLAVLIKAAPVIRGMGHSITWTHIEELLGDVEKSAEGTPERDAVAAVRSWYVAQAASVAFCAGIVQFVRDQSGQTSESTLRAFSVRKVMGEHSSQVNKGLTYARAYYARIREQADKGEFPDPMITV